MLRKIIKNIIDTLIVFECLFIKQELHTKKRVLIFRKDALGDFVIFLPTLPYYREYYKDYDISLVVSNLSIEELKPLFSFIDDIIIFNQKKFRTNFWYRRFFIRSLVKKGFDIAIYPVYSSEKIGDIIMKATRANKILDFKTITVANDLNELDKNMEFVSKVVGKHCDAQFPTINVSLLDKKNFEKISLDYSLLPRKYIVIVPGAGATYKMWQLSKMSDIVDYCIQKGFDVVLCGVVDEKKLGEEIIKQSNHKDKIINLISKTDIPTLVHIVANARLYFGNDTGTLHLSAAVETPSVAIMGGWHFGRFFPYGNLNINRIVFDSHMKCKGDNGACLKKIPKGEIAVCIKNITVMDVKKEIDNILVKLS